MVATDKNVDRVAADEARRLGTNAHIESIKRREGNVEQCALNTFCRDIVLTGGIIARRKDRDGFSNGLPIEAALVAPTICL